MRFVQSQNDILLCVKGPEKVSIQSIVRQSGHNKRMKNVHPTFLEIMRWFTTLKVTRIDDGITGAIS